MDRMKRFARQSVSYLVAMTMVFSLMQISVFAQDENTLAQPATTEVADQTSASTQAETNKATNTQSDESPPASNEATESTKVEEKTDANKSSGEDPSATQKAAEEKAKAEKEAAEKAAQEKAEAKKKAEENAMPAQTFTGTTGQLKVYASVNANVFPSGTIMKVTAVNSSLAKSIASKSTDNNKVVKDAIGVDITFYKDGKELQPADAKAVNVKITLNESLEGQDFKVLHQKESGTIEQMNASVNDHNATFNAKSFSIYVIVSEDNPAISTYNFYNGDKLISEYTQKIKAGDTLKKPKSPEKEGYKFIGWATIKDATTPNFDAFKQYDLVDGQEHNINAVFEEVHYVFFMDGTSDDARVFKTKEGKEGDKVSTTDVKLDLASDQSVTGWYSDKTLSSKVEDTITLGKGDIRLYPKIESGHYITFKTGKNGSYVEPQFYGAKANVTDQSLPTPSRKGYTFKYWSASEDGAKYVTGNTLSEDITLYAVWTADQTNYSIVYWKQSTSDAWNAENKDKTYQVDKSESHKAATGSTILLSGVDTTAEHGFKLNKAKSTEKITVYADGKSTLNVYFDRQVVTFNFQYPRRSNEYNKYDYGIESHSGLYGSKIDFDWPSYYTYLSKKTNILWKYYNYSSKATTTTTYLNAYIPGDTSRYTIDFSVQDTGNAVVSYYKESLDGKEEQVKDIYSDGGVFYIKDKFEGFYAAGYKVDGDMRWNELSGKDQNGIYLKVDYKYELSILFKRNSYNLEYYNYDHEDKTKRVKYEAPLASYANYTPSRPESLDSGYTFRGWYKDEACTVPFDFGLNMPANGIKLYAKWAADPVDVTAHLSLKTDETTIIEDVKYASTLSQSALPQVVDADGKTIVEGDTSHTVKVPAHYHWLGWATKDNEGNYILYNFNKELRSDLELYPYYINANKFVVNYLSNGGKGTVTDDKKYAENAYADVKSAKGLEAPSGSMFLNWQLYLQNDDGKFIAQDEYYYPGDKVKITGNIQLVAHYIPLPTKVNLLYYANNSTSSEGVKASNDDLENNAQLTIANGSNVASPQVGKGVKAIFDHWNTKPDDSGTTYRPGDKVGIDDKDMPNKLYAQWRYEVTIIGHSDSVTYTGEKQKLKGIVNDQFTIEDQTIKVDDVTAIAEGTDVGDYKTKFTFGKSYSEQAKVINGFKVKVITNPGTLTITPNKTGIKITLKDASKVYDGKALTSNAFEVSGLPKGLNVTVQTNGSQTDAGTSDNKIASYTITKNGKDVKDWFTNVDTSSTASLTVTKRPVTLESESATKEFDGTPLTQPDVKVTSGEFVKGEIESLEATGSITNAGTTKNTIQINGVAGKYKESNYAITKDEGTLTITKIAKTVSFIAASDSKEYDGTPLTNATVKVNGLPDGYDFSASAKGSITHVKEGKVNNVVDQDSVHIYKDGKDVTDQFKKIEYTNGKLSITPRTLTLTSASDTKAYDGTPLTKNVVTYDAARILNNDIYDMKATGSQTNVGSSDNTISYTIKDDVKDDYKVKEELGLLTVTKSEKEITIKADDASQIYDGTPLTSDSFSVDGLDLTIFKVTADSHGSMIDAGTADHTIDQDSVKIFKGDKDVTGWFTNIKVESGLLIVNPRPVTITTGSASKEYDGTPLTNDKITIGDMGFVNGEATAQTTGTITEVGSTNNTYEIVKGKGYKDGNYAITNNLGTLTITDNNTTEVTITAKSATKIYDGTPLTAGYEVTGLNKKLFTIEVTTKGSITNAGTINNVIDSYIIRNNDGKDVTDAFKTVKKVNGTLTINKRNVILTSESKSKQFDGHSLTAKDVTVTGDGFVKGEVEDLKATGTITYPGSVTNTIEYTTKENFKAGNYTITKREGTLTVNKNAAEIVVTPGSISRKYDGTALTYDHGTVTGVPDGFTYKLHTKGTITHVGSVDNEVDTFVIEKDGKDVTKYFSNITYKTGSLTITPREVTITSGTKSFVYDGNKHIYDYIEVTGDAILDKDIKAIHATGEITKVGSQVNTIEITPTENFVERDYTFNKVEGILTVTKHADEVVLTANSATKVYDGTPLTNKMFTDNLPDGFKATVTVSGSITDAGTTENKITAYKIMKDGEDVTDQFDKITTVNGTLTVNKRDVTITSESATKEYDGQPLTNAAAHVTGEIINDEIYAIVATGTQTDVGSTENTIHYETSKDFKASNYNLTVHPGTLTVTKNTTAKVIIQAASASKMYDGQALEKAEATTTGLPEGISAKVTVEGSIRHTGIKANLVTDYHFYKGNQEVTDFFDTPEVNDGVLEITKRSVTLRSASDEKEYDGTPLTNANVTITGDGFVEGEVKEVKAIGSITDVGNTENTIHIEKNDGYDPLDYTIEEDLGTLTITQNTTAKIKVTADSASKLYDGKALTKNTYSVTGLPEAFKVKATVTGSITNVKDSPVTNKLSDVKIFKKDQDVTQFFKNISSADGQLEITKRHVKIESGSAKRVYNGSPLTNKDITISGDGFVDGEAKAKATGTITQVGKTPNTIEIEKYDGYLASNYAIETSEGTLEITPVTNKMTITAASDEKLYDGKALTNNKFEVKGLPEGFTLKATITGTITNAGTVTNKVTDYKILKDGQDVKDQFTNVQLIDGQLAVNKRHVKLTSETKEKEFDGTPLTAPDVKVTGDGFVDGEVKDLKATGSITKVGSTTNSISYIPTQNFNVNNYNIEEAIGTLTIKKISKEVKVTSNDATKTYDGKALTNKTYTIENLPDGFTIKVEITGTITNAGQTNNTIKSVIIMKDGDDVTDQFETISAKEGKLSVNKRNVTLTSESATREYNGQALTRPTVTISGDGFVDGEVDDVKATGTIIKKGQVDNTITYTTHPAFNKDNYTIKKSEGVLKIIANNEKIIVRSATDTKVYDSEPLSNTKTTIENLPDNFTYQATLKGSVTHVDEGIVENEITDIYIFDQEGKDVTDQFENIIKMNGTLSITPRKLTITSQSDTKEYDGHALSNDLINVKGKIYHNEVYDIAATGSIIEPGNTKNTIVYKTTKHAEKDYAITLEEGTLTVTTHHSLVSVTAGSDSKVYDGNALTSDKFTVEGLPENLKAYVTTAGAATNVDDKGENKVNTVVIMDGMTDVTQYFTNIKTTSGKLTITPRNVTLKSESDHKVYDGKILTRPDVKVSGKGFVKGEATTKAIGSIKKIGSVPNTIQLDPTDAYKEVNYNITYDTGTLTIIANENAVVINGSNVSKTYDGQALSSDKADVILPEGFENYQVDVKMKGEITNAGKIANKVGQVIIKDEDGHDVTDQFTNITKNDGYLEITPRKVTLTSDSVTRAYDGTALTAKKVTVSGDGFVADEVSDLRATGSITNVGTTSNLISYKKQDAYKDENYIITRKPGTLTITTAQNVMSITAASDEKTYDGQPLTNDIYQTTGVLDGMHIKATIKGEITNAGVATNKVVSYSIMKGDQDVTDYFNTDNEHMIITDGTLTVHKRPITLTSATLSKAYDGTPLTNGDHALNVTKGSYVEGESFKVGFTGRQILVGTSDNTFTLSNAKAKLGNYDVEKVYGRLTVTDQVDDDKVVTKSHDGQDYKLGDTIHFTITIKNIYDEVKTLKVTELPGVKMTSKIPETLDAGEEITLKAEYIVTEEEIKTQSFKNKVEVSLGKTYKGTDEVPEEEIDDAKPKIKITKVADHKEYKLGDTITYKIYAKNTGNLTLTNIVVKDDLTNTSWIIAKLAPGETSQDLIATYKVTESDIKVGKVVNVATVDKIDDPTPHNPDDPKPDVTPGKEIVETEESNPHLTISKKADAHKAYKLGETIHYTIHATNDGNLTLTNIVIGDDLTGETWTIKSLAPNETSQDFTTSYVITEKDIKKGQVKNIATMKDVDDPTPEDPIDPDPTDAPGEETVETEDKNPHLTIKKNADDKKYRLGETVTYTISAINDGNLTLTNIKLKDDLTNDTWTIKKLAPGATSKEHVVTYVVTEKDIIAGQIKNIVTMSDVDDPTPEDPNDPDPTDQPGEKIVDTEDKNPHLTITKKADSSKQYTLGDTITYKIHAKNDGNITLTNIVLKDDLTGDTFTIESLKPQETSDDFVVSYKVTQKDVNAGKVTNVATVAKVDDPTPNDPTDPNPGVTPGKEEVEITKTNPSITVTKKTTSTPKDGKAYKLNETISYEITVKNDGNLALSTFKLRDDMTNETFDVKALKPGETQSFTTSYKVTEADVVKGQVINNATVDTSTLEDPTPDNKEDDVKITNGKTTDPTETSHPAIQVSKTTTSTPANTSGYQEGETISYLITATNTGNLTLTNVVVEDPLTNGKWTIAKLAPKAQKTFVTTYIVKSLDVVSGQVVNSATITSSEDPDPQKDPEVTPGSVTTPTSKTTIIDNTGSGEIPTQNTPEMPTIASPVTQESGSNGTTTQNTPQTPTTVEKETLPTANSDNETPTVVKTTTYETGNNPTTTTSTVKTGDETEIIMQLMLMSIALITLLGVLIATRKKKENRN